MSDRMAVFLVLTILVVAGSLVLVSLVRMFKTGLGVGLLGLVTFPFGPMFFFWSRIYRATDGLQKLGELKQKATWQSEVDENSAKHSEFVAKFNRENAG